MTDLSTAAQQLQAVPLEDFVAERKRLAKELRDGGDREAAAELAKLPKPTPPAWALNQLARDEPDLIYEWLDAAAALRDASESAAKGSGGSLRAAMTTHREATRAVIAAARDKTRPSGRELSEAMLERVRDMLQLATLDPGESERLRAGVIVEGDEETAPPPATTRKEKPRKRKQAGDGEPAKAEREAEERARREAEERAELERVVAAAEEKLDELRAVVHEREAAAGKADERLAEARRAVTRTESEAAAAHDAVEEATSATEQAERELRKLSAKLGS